MSTAAAISLICGVIWSLPLYFGLRHRDPYTVVVAVLALAVNFLLGSGHLLAGNVMRIWSTGLVAVLLIDRLTQRPEHVKRVLTTQLADAREELHHTRSDARSWEARAVAYRRLLDQHDIEY